MKYSIVYSSKTGNTKMLADFIQDELAKDSRQDCIYCGKLDDAALAADRLYVGFWTDKGTSDTDATTFLQKLRNKEVFLFGTAGFGGEQSYFDRLVDNAQRNLDDSNHVIGSFMCQGKMPLSVRERYEKMLNAPNGNPNMQAMIENFDRALNHPSQEDLNHLKSKLQEIK